MVDPVQKAVRYVCNPDVVLREEDEEGGLLFNPDTNQVKVVNTTGLFIWKQFAEENSREAVVRSILDHFEESETETVRTDLDEFLEDMIQTGFIGEAVT